MEYKVQVFIPEKNVSITAKGRPQYYSHMYGCMCVYNAYGNDRQIHI